MIRKFMQWLFRTPPPEVQVVEPVVEVPQVIEAFVISEPVLALANLILDSAELVIETEYSETAYFYEEHKLRWPSLDLDLTIIDHTDDELKQHYSAPHIWEVASESWMTPAEEDYIIHTFKEVLQRRQAEATVAFQAREAEEHAQLELEYKAEQERRRAKFAALVTK